MNRLKVLKQNRTLLWKLAKNDFRNKFAGSYFGVIWAFIQPMVTVAVYFCVFQLGLHASPAANGYPYICWLVSGIIPWFFFIDAVPSAGNCLLEYSYLVKKVMFQIDILPIVKVVSSFFVHIFFIGFTLLVFVCMGKLPSIFVFQVLYYMICLVILVVALAYFNCAIMPFFRDFSQIVNVIISVGMWATPILWDKTTIDVSVWFDRILKLNPVYYIVQGYRDSFMNGVGFWEHPGHTIYFWCFMIVFFWFSNRVFDKLRVHFSDVI